MELSKKHFETRTALVKENNDEEAMTL